MFAILGFLANGSKSGYEIKRVITERTRHFWNESFGQIYPLLRELETMGLIEKGDAESVGRRASQKYRITPDGLDFLKEWLREPVEPMVIRNELLLKIFFGKHTDPQVLIEHLSAYQRRAEEDLRFFEQRLEALEDPGNIADHPHAFFLLAPLQHGIASGRARAAWCRDTIKTLSRTDRSSGEHVDRPKTKTAKRT